MRPTASVCLIVMTALALAACTARLDPRWTINERTPIATKANDTGLVFPAGATPDRAPGLARTQSGCSAAGASSEGVRGAVQPGVGAYVHIDYWTSAAVPGLTARTMPAQTSFDGVLRLVAPDGQLRAQEKTLLATFLTVNRSAYSQDIPSREDRIAAAEVVDRNQTALWNAFVGNLCVAFIAAPVGSDRSALSFTSDVLQLCEAVRKARDPKLSYYSQVFVYARAPGEDVADCTFPAPVLNAAPRPPLAPGTLLGTLASNAANTLGMVAAGTATRLDRTSFYDQSALQIAALGDITLQRPRFGERGTETWSLLDWEASGTCLDAADRTLAIRRVTLDGGAGFAIGTGGNYRLIRRLTQSGYERRVEPVDGKRRRKSLAHSDLAYLTPADVTHVEWRDPQGRRARSSCSPRD